MSRVRTGWASIRAALIAMAMAVLPQATFGQTSPEPPSWLCDFDVDPHCEYAPFVTPTAADPVLLRTGDFTLEETDLTVRSRGMDISMTRYYRSGASLSSAVGNKWTFNWDQAIVLEYLDYYPPPEIEWGGPVSGDGQVEGPVTIGDSGPPPPGESPSPFLDDPWYRGTYLLNGHLRLDRFLGPGTEHGELMSSTAHFAKLKPVGNAPAPMGNWKQHPAHFELRRSDGSIYTFGLRDYADPTVAGIVYRLTSIEDRQGNRISLSYKTAAKKMDFAAGPAPYPTFLYHRLFHVVGPLGRSLEFSITGAIHYKDKLNWVRDSSSYPQDAPNCAAAGVGRTVYYTHGADHNLTEVRSPVVVGTPTQNDFCDGILAQYEYDDGGTDETKSRLTKVFQGQQVADAQATGGDPIPYLTNSYEDLPVATNAVRSQLFGHHNPLTAPGGVPAGGLHGFAYESFNEQWDDQVGGEPAFTSARRTLSTDPNGNTTLTVYDVEGRDRLTILFTGRLDPWDAASNTGPSFGGLHNINRSAPSQNQGLASPLEPKLHSSDPDCFITRRDFNSDGQVTRLRGPESETVYTYDDGPDVFQNRNVILIENKPVPDDGSPTIVTGYAYDPVFNQKRLAIDPRAKAIAKDGWQPPMGSQSHPGDIFRFVTQNTFDYEEGCCLASFQDELEEWEIDQAQGSARATLENAIDPALGTYFNCGHRGECNEDQNFQIFGNVIEKTNWVSVPGDISAEPMAFGLQEVSATYIYNDYSNLVSSTDPEGHTVTYDYYSEADPDGDGTVTVPPAELSWVLDTAEGASGGGFLKRSKDLGTGIEQSFTYDELGRAASRTDGRGYVWHSEHNALDQLVREVDPRGYETLHIYDASGNLVELKATNVVPELDGNHHPTGNEVPGASGSYLSSLFTYDILNQLVQSDVPESQGSWITTRHRYDRAGNRVATLSPNSISDASSITTTILDERGLIWRQSHGGRVPAPSGSAPGFLGPMAHAELALDPALTAAGSSSAVTETFSFNTEGNIVSKEDAAGYETTYEYDSFQRLVDTKDAVGTVYRLGYDPASNQVRRASLRAPYSDTDPASVLEEARYQFDELGRTYQVDQLLASIDSSLPTPDGPLTPGDGWVTSRTLLDGRGLALETVDDNKAQVDSTYDSLGRPITETLVPFGDRTVTTYNGNSDVIGVRLVELAADGSSIPNSNKWFAYDQIGRLTTEVDQLGNTSRYAYDSRGNLVFESDAQSSSMTDSTTIPYQEWSTGIIVQLLIINNHGNTIVHSYDDANRNLSSTRHLRSNGNGTGSVQGFIDTSQAYDANSNVISRTDGENNPTQYSYDSLDRPETTTYADTTVSSVDEYDPRGMPRIWTDQNGTKVTAEFDGVGRVTRRTPDYTGSAATVAQTISLEEFGYDGVGRLTWASDDDTNVVRRYDTLGRVIEEVLTGPDGVPSTVQCQFDGVGLLRKTTYPMSSGRVVERDYDEANRLESVWDASSTIAEYTYEGFDRVSSRWYPANDTAMEVSYDDLRRAVSVQHLSSYSSVPTSFDDRSYQYDRMHNSAVRTHAERALEFQLEYDSVYRLVDSALRQAGALVRDVAYNYDNVGNRLSVAIDGAAQSYEPTDPDDAKVNQYTNTPFGPTDHDDKGNLGSLGLAGLEMTYEFDPRDQLSSVLRPDGLRVDCAYDATGRRVSMTTTPLGGVSVVTRFVHAGAHVIEEVEAGVSRTFVHGQSIDELLVTSNGSQDQFTHEDSLGSVVAVSDSGGYVEDFIYADFGEVLDPTSLAPMDLGAGAVSAAGLPYLYGGHRLDADTGLYWLRTRYLLPKLGRFVSRDTLGIWGDSTNLGNGSAYCGNNPWSFVDPFGTERVSGTPWDGEQIYVPPGGSHGGCELPMNPPSESLPPWASPVAWISAWTAEGTLGENDLGWLGGPSHGIMHNRGARGPGSSDRASDKSANDWDPMAEFERERREHEFEGDAKLPAAELKTADGEVSQNPENLKVIVWTNDAWNLSGTLTTGAHSWVEVRSSDNATLVSVGVGPGDSPFFNSLANYSDHTGRELSNTARGVDVTARVSDPSRLAGDLQSMVGNPAGAWMYAPGIADCNAFTASALNHNRGEQGAAGFGYNASVTGYFGVGVNCVRAGGVSLSGLAGNSAGYMRAAPSGSVVK